MANIGGQHDEGVAVSVRSINFKMASSLLVTNIAGSGPNPEYWPANTVLTPPLASSSFL